METGLTAPPVRGRLARGSHKGRSVLRWAVTLGCLLLTTGCVGQASDLPEELAVYDFVATVAPSGTDTPGGSFDISLEMTSVGNTVVETDIVLKVTRADGSPVVERRFDRVLFHPEENWALGSSFVPGSDDRGRLSFEVIVYRHGTDEVLWRSPTKSELVVL